MANNVQLFIDDLIIKEEEANLYINALQTSYLTWCQLNNEMPVDFHLLTDGLEKHFDISVMMNLLIPPPLTYHYEGIKLNLPSQSLTEWKKRRNIT